ncbi:MAG TPA: hypothetical protein VFC47_15065 [Caulobacteraceae bacterium]|nr:hypothetical protein [Caulobacteraceae bacterium]
MDVTRFEPPSDPVYRFLMDGAADGSVPVYSLSVPFEWLLRHDPFWAPERSPDGQRAMQKIMARLGDGENLRPWVYPRGGKLIVSDDYLLLACFAMLQPPTLGVWHLLLPDPALRGKGPLPLGRVHELIVASITLV